MVEFLSIFSFAQMLLCAILLAPLRKENSSILLYILLMLSCCGYLLGAINTQTEPNAVLWWLGHIGGNALPGIFWLVSLSVFGDHIALKKWQYCVASLTLVIPLSSELLQLAFSFQLNTYQEVYGFIHYGSLLLELVLISHALITSVKYWRDDLVQERRYIRGGVITISSIYIILVIVFEQILNVEWLFLDIMKSALLVVLVTGINFFLFRLKESSLFETVSPFSDKTLLKKHTSKASRELMKIIESMEQDKLYQKEGITISGLAKHLAIHEYKLRNLINGELNYRNFNDFLNFYRIKEVTTSLISPSFAHLPVLTLALESGFRSLSSFNKAFKNTHGITPTEYRKKHLVE